LHRSNIGWKQSLTGGPAWKETLRVENSDQTVAIPLKATIARAEAEHPGYWPDPAAKIVWAAADNGSGVTWSQAVYNCNRSRPAVSRIGPSPQ
jgi:hypothetical protein